jgi:hypothetical protein
MRKGLICRNKEQDFLWDPNAPPIRARQFFGESQPWDKALVISDLPVKREIRKVVSQLP